MAAEWRYRNTQEAAGLRPSSVSACDGSTSSGTGLCKSVLGSRDVLLQRSESTRHTETGSGLDQDAVGHRTVWMCNMTLEETGGESSTERMDSVAQALEEVLSSALPQGCITVGVYEAAKSLNADPDNVVLCLLAAEHEDVALQIHFTLIQAFCCENDINILRVGNMRRLAEILGGVKPGGEPMDLHCVLVTNPQSALWKDPALSKVNRFCSDSRCLDQWVPVINLPDR